MRERVCVWLGDCVIKWLREIARVSNRERRERERKRENDCERGGGGEGGRAYRDSHFSAVKNAYAFSKFLITDLKEWRRKWKQSCRKFIKLHVQKFLSDYFLGSFWWYICFLKKLPRNTSWIIIIIINGCESRVVEWRNRVCVCVCLPFT